MISFRQHVVTLVAVFLALAVGVVLGGGPLSDLGRDAPAASAATRERVATRTADYGDRFAAAVGPSAYAGKLAQHPVSIITLPGADGDVVKALGKQVAAAGGSVAATYPATAALTDASQKSLVDTLGSQLMTQLTKGAVDADATTYQRMGELIALAIGAGPATTADVTSVRESLAGAELLTTPQDAKPGGLVLVVLGDDVDPAVLSGLTAGIAAKATAVVVAGSTAAGTAAGSLTALRKETPAAKVATVDGVDTALGQVTATLALIRSLTTPGGSFGASGADGAVPLG